MRRFIAFIIFTKIILFCYAQKISLGFETGINLCSIKANDDMNSHSKGMSAGWQIGGTASYVFKNNITLLSAITFMHTQRKAEFTPWKGNTFPEAQIKSNQITLPIKIGYTFLMNDIVCITPLIGTFVSYHFNGGHGNMNHYDYVNGERTLTKAKWNPMHEFTYYAYGVNEGGQAIEAYKNHLASLRRWTWGAVGGINATFKDHYTASLQYMEDIKRIHKDLNFRDYSLVLSVGYIF